MTTPDTKASFLYGTDLSIDSVDLRFKQILTTNTPDTIFKTVDNDGNFTVYYGNFVDKSPFVTSFEGISSDNQPLYNFSTSKSFDANFLKSAIEKNNKNAFFDIVLGGNDLIVGSSQNDILSGYLGNDTINGNSGDDTAFFNGNYADFVISKGDVLTVKNKNTNETDTLENIEFLKFKDKQISVNEISVTLVVPVIATEIKEPDLPLPKPSNSKINAILLNAPNVVLNEKNKTNASNVAVANKTNSVLTTVENMANAEIILNNKISDDSLSFLDEGKIKFSTTMAIKGIEILNLSANGNDVDFSLLKQNPFKEIVSNEGKNTIVGSAGADVFYLKGGSNEVKTGKGNDVFKIDTTSNGNLTISDFESGKDKFSFTGREIIFYGNYENLIQAQNTLLPNSGKIQIVYQKDKGILWVNVNDDSVLDENDFKINFSKPPSKVSEKDIGVSKITTQDKISPSVDAATVNDKLLSVIYSENVVFEKAAKKNFTVLTDGVVNPVLEIVADKTNSKSLNLTLEKPVKNGQHVILIYISSNDKVNEIQDFSGNYANSFANIVVKNETPSSAFNLKVSDITESNLTNFNISDNVVVLDSIKNIENGIDNLIKNIDKIDAIQFVEDGVIKITDHLKINKIVPLLTSKSLDLSALPPVELVEIPSEIIAQLTPKSIASLNAENAAVLTEQQVSSFSDSQLKALSPVQVSFLSEAVLKIIQNNYVTIFNSLDSTSGGVELSNHARGTNHDDYIFTNSKNFYSILGGEGDDYVKTGNGNDTLNGENGNDYLAGGNGEDILNGNDGDDFLDGEAGNDSLNGGKGNDFLASELGTDSLTGGEGKDTFSIVHHQFDQSNIPTVTDFKTGFDKLEIKISNSSNDSYTNVLNSSDNYFEITKITNKFLSANLSLKGIVAIQNKSDVDIYYSSDMSDISASTLELVIHLKDISLIGITFTDFSNLWV